MAESVLMLFADKDDFLRRVSYEDHFKHDVLLWKAFKDKDPWMS